jgi:hypothetical protein
MIRTKSLVISKLPNAGLGNKLFTWGHGVIFAKKNELRHYSIGWTKIKIGPILRRETSLRFYRNYFKSSVLVSKIKFIFFKKSREVILKSYLDCQKTENVDVDSLYIFNEVPHWSDYFKGLRENQEFVVDVFFKSLSPKIYDEYLKKKEPVIGVHIRMGDFKKVAATQDFSKVGHARTPMQYFIDVISQLRTASEITLPVTIFSDGNANELSEVLSLPNVYLAEDDLDILQMLHLSKSKIIVLSAGSTFGQWAAFLSNAAIINHYQHFHSYIRPSTTNVHSFEGVIDINKPLPNELTSYCKNL